MKERIRELMDGDSTSAFARKCGISESLLRKYLLGAMPSADRAAAIAAVRGVTADWLITGHPPKMRADLVEAMKGVDKARLQTAIAAVTEGVSKSGKLVAIDKQAELINASYELAKDHDKAFIVRFITVAAM
jgi:transcriptional regulator with XRE-family HTH domain